MDYRVVLEMIKNYNSNKRFIKRIQSELLVIETKYFGARSSSVLGNPGGSNNESVHTLATLGQEKLDQLNKRYQTRYEKALESVAYVDALLDRLPVEPRDMIVHTYIKRRYVDELALQHRCTRATIYNRMNAAIKEDCELLD